MIIYEDNDILVCHKRAGMPVQSASVREKDMVSVLRNHLSGADVYVVHRLDQPVEGVLVFAKTKAAAADLSRQIANGSMRKIYQAVVELPENTAVREAGAKTDAGESGKMTDGQDFFVRNEWYMLVDYLVKDGRNNRSFVSEEGKPGAKQARLRYRILKWWIESQPICRKEEWAEADIEENTKAGSVRRLALVEIELMTGRHHQIRVQMAHSGLPLAGDRKYNPRYAENSFATGCDGRSLPSSANEMRKTEASLPLALCAVSLTLRHPSTKKRMTFEVTPHFSAIVQ